VAATAKQQPPCSRRPERRISSAAVRPRQQQSPGRRPPLYDYLVRSEAGGATHRAHAGPQQSQLVAIYALLGPGPYGAAGQLEFQGSPRSSNLSDQQESDGRTGRDFLLGTKSSSPPWGFCS
jgi:hypothetical protein